MDFSSFLRLFQTRMFPMTSSFNSFGTINRVRDSFSNTNWIPMGRSLASVTSLESLISIPV